MNVVRELIPFVAKHTIHYSFEAAFDQLAMETVQFNAGMVWHSKTLAAHSGSRHAEIPTIFLHQNAGRNVGLAKEGMLTLIYVNRLRNVIGIRGIGKIPAFWKFGR